VCGHDVTADGRQFFFAENVVRLPIRVTELIVVRNWLEDVTARVPGEPQTAV
jgi:hypothetical protein